MKICLMFLVVLMLLLNTHSLFAQDNEKEFQRIGKMNIRELTPVAKAALEKKYPNEKWEKYNFPKYAYINDSVLVGYKIAIKEPQLLAKFPCYCFCDVTMSHRNLSYCYLAKGTLLGGFDPHGAECTICNGQAVMAFLWQEIGIDVPKMQAAMKPIFRQGG
jgi:Protein of unknown function with PCYCGC motif